MEFLIVAVAVVLIFIVNNIISPKSILGQVSPWVRSLMEKDYEFLLRVKYKDKDLDINVLFSRRIRELYYLYCLLLDILVICLYF